MMTDENVNSYIPVPEYVYPLIFNMAMNTQVGDWHGLIPLLNNLGICRLDQDGVETIKLKESVFQYAPRLMSDTSNLYEGETNYPADSSIVRPQMEVMFLIDTSSSMELSLSEYNIENGCYQQSPDEPKKIELATELLGQIIQGMQSSDKVGIVGFGDSSSVIKSPTKISEINLNKLKKRVEEIQLSGTSEARCGLEKASEQFSSSKTASEDVKRRVVTLMDSYPFLTQPGISDIISSVESISSRSIYMTLGLLGLQLEPKTISRFEKTTGTEIFEIY